MNYYAQFYITTPEIEPGVMTYAIGLYITNMLMSRLILLIY